MAKHRRYSRKRSHRKNRRRSRKMIGGVDTPTPPSLHLSDLDVSGESLNNTEQSVDMFNPDYSGDTTINSNDWSIGQQNELEQDFPDFGEEPIPQAELHDVLDDDDIDLDLSIDNSINTTKETLLDDSTGGKRRRLSKKNKRKTKISKKSRKNRKKVRGGGEGDSMDTEYLNVNERDKKDYDQMINILNWSPEQSV